MSHSCSRPRPCSGEHIMPRITEYQSPVSGLFPHRHPDRCRTGPQVINRPASGLRLSPPRPEARARAFLRGWYLTLPGLATAWLGFRAGGFFPGQVGLVALTLALVLVGRITLARRPFEGWSPALALASGALAGLAVWTLASALWSDAPARALAEFDRTLLYGLGSGADRQRGGPRRRSVHGAALDRCSVRRDRPRRAAHPPAAGHVPDLEPASCPSGSRSRSPTGTRWASPARSARCWRCT